jgi:hypothetical protein
MGLQGVRRAGIELFPEMVPPCSIHAASLESATAVCTNFLLRFVLFKYTGIKRNRLKA